MGAPLGPRAGTSRRSRGLVASMAMAVVACAPAPPPEFGPSVRVDLPEATDVEAVVFLVGDAGDAERGTSPVLARLGADVEYWSERIEADSAVTVLFLGDNVYPDGIRDRDHRAFERDSSRLWSQIDVVGGTAARSRGARGLFMAGNHDWGNMAGEGGLARLRNQEDQIDEARASGLAVRLLPAAGRPGPVVVDLEERARLVLMDTHWFLQEPDARARAAFFEELRAELVGAGDRHLILAAHHPYQSAGPHGDLTPGMKALGLTWLMKKSGTLVQDLNSPIYGDLLGEMRESFRSTGRRPLIFAGGHDHSLQVMDPITPDGPHNVLVSGAGSKLTELAPTEQLRYAAARPGYMTVVFRRDGAVDLFVMAGTEARETPCAGIEGPDLEVCVSEGATDMQLVYSERLVAEGGVLEDGSRLRDSGAARRAPGRPIVPWLPE